VTVNLESVIILENKLSRVASNVKQIKQLNFITANQTAINAFSAQLKEVVDICEDVQRQSLADFANKAFFYSQDGGDVTAWISDEPGRVQI
jgi:uncharacterized coiled-coil protein SlyX